jgi:V8-like Glu-specific endopeptidase
MQGTQRRVSNPIRPPYSAVGLLRMHFTDGNWYWGSGALINNQQVLTCGHNLFDVPNQHQADQIRFYPGWNGDTRPVVAGAGQTPFIAARCAFYAAAYNDTTQYPEGQTEWDIGLVNLNAPVNPVPPFYFIPQTVNNTALVGRDLDLAGYPGDHPGQMWIDRLPVEGIAPQYNTLSHLHETFKGSSGSPMYEYDSMNEIVRLYAVHVEGPNDLRRATLLTPAIMQKLSNTAYHAPAHAGGFALHTM